MKKYINWFLKYVDVINTFLLINVIALLILDFGIKINTNTINILIAIAAVASTFLLYLAFRESKKSNDLKISEPIYNYLKNEGNILIKNGNEEIFSSDRIKYLSSLSKYPETHLHKICCIVFDYNISELLRHIEEHTNYKRYIKLLGNNNKVQLKYEILLTEDAKQLSLAFQMIKLCTSEIFHYYYAIFESCDRIYNSSLQTKHKELLLEKQLENTGTFEVLCHDLIINKQSILYLRDFIAFELNNENEIIPYKFEINNQLIDIYNKIQDIKKIYFDS